MAKRNSIIARAVSRLPSTSDEARHVIYEQARTALYERLGNDPHISNDELVTEHHRLEAAIHRVEEDLLLSAMRRFVKEETASPCLKGKGVRTLSGRQVCPAERVLTWIKYVDLQKCYPVKLGEALPWCCVPLLRRIAVSVGCRAWRSFAQMGRFLAPGPA
jgi:hypothetical protein